MKFVYWRGERNDEVKVNVINCFKIIQHFLVKKTTIFRIPLILFEFLMNIQRVFKFKKFFMNKEIR